MSTHPAFSPRRALAAAAILATSLGLTFLAGCGGDDNPTNPTPSGPTSTVHIVMNAMSKGAAAYSPNPDTVSVNTTVVWRNDDSITHTVTSNTSGQFNMTVSAGSSASHKFTSVGTFGYHCTISGHVMNGTIEVVP